MTFKLVPCKYPGLLSMLRSTIDDEKPQSLEPCSHIKLQQKFPSVFAGHLTQRSFSSTHTHDMPELPPLSFLPQYPCISHDTQQIPGGYH